ncbi:MAG: FAD-dependent oxidoreductase, partial [Lachnospiraceae bacterium]|nr:FAD-dependent oxidoreductase [Lachnospiraceae bacterium]
MYDVIIIGAGVTGCAVARELSRYKVNVCVLDKEEDVCSGTSKANSAIIHAGFDAPTGSLMARFNVRGNEMMDDFARDLDIPFKRNGAMVVCIHESEKDGLKDLYDRGIANGVKGLEILDREQALEKEPNLTENVVAALYAPTSGIICPFMLNIAMAENANVNGVDFFFNTEVEKLTPATCEKCG